MSEQIAIRRRTTRRHAVLLAFTIFGGTGAWTVNLFASYVVATYACGEGFAVPALLVVTLVTATLVAGSLTAAARLLLASADGDEPRERPEYQRDRFLASGGILLGGLALMAITFNVLAVLLAACRP